MSTLSLTGLLLLIIFTRSSTDLPDQKLRFKKFQPIVTVNLDEGVMATIPLLGIAPDNVPPKVSLSGLRAHRHTVNDVEGKEQSGFALVPSPPPKW